MASKANTLVRILPASRECRQNKRFLYTLKDYSKDIIDILSQVPQGLPIRAVVKHIYNAHNTFFETVDIDDVKKKVTNYLTSHAKSRKSPIEKGDRWGVYRVDMAKLQELANLAEVQEEAQKDKNWQEQSLGLIFPEEE